MSVCIILPVSREQHLPLLFAALELLDCNRETTSLLTYVDGGSDLFLQSRNLTESSKFANRLCIQRKPDGVKLYSYVQRRPRIAAIHNELKQHVPDCEYVMGLEDDSIPRPDALKRLLKVYGLYPYAGLVSGVEIGRHGIFHLGLWSVDDVYEPTTIISLMPAEGVQEIDAAGMYCFLSKRENYVKHEFKPFGNNALGPDVEWSLSLRQQGFMNYCDFGVPVEHRRDDGSSLTLGNTEVLQVRLTKTGDEWPWTVLTS